MQRIKAQAAARDTLEADAKARDAERVSRQKGEKDALEKRLKETAARERNELRSKHAREQKADAEACKRQRVAV